MGSKVLGYLCLALVTLMFCIFLGELTLQKLRYVLFSVELKAGKMQLW